ncbi:GNAT family N-acetyltransferase [Oceanobacillus halotolerans]|uniref:GNAT family N-acetyltransferase n=1 Tax=Oceanobacillus halotolerans TaxID=2663380 RepID=UPI0013DC7EFA|nr:GNAT family N-acetyltransferase [Oceanobacillus halotolerans]
MTDHINIRQLTSMDEMKDMQVVEETVWQMPPTPVHQTYTALNNGGIILGAFDGEKMIGFLYSFAGFDGEKPYLCSHMLGILPEYRKDGLGRKMKLKQAAIAKEKGYSMITWTFDPLESLNAYLNIHKLGAIGAHYKENHYGSMNDGLNQGLPTDRIQIEWNMDDTFTSPNLSLDTNKLLVDVNENGVPKVSERFTSDFTGDQHSWFVPIPTHFQDIKKENIERAKQWRYETRRIFQALFQHGYVAKNVIRDDSNALTYYYFSKK